MTLATAPTLQSWREAVEADPRMQAARGTLNTAEEQAGRAAEEHASLETALTDATAELDRAGPDTARELSRRTRELRGEVEDLSAEVAAITAAAARAKRDLRRTRAAVMSEVWNGLPFGDVTEQWRERLRALLASTQELQALAREHALATNHVVGILRAEADAATGGDFQAPRFVKPDPGIPDLDFRRFAQDLERIIQRMTPK